MSATTSTCRSSRSSTGPLTREARRDRWETTCFDVTPISYAQLGLLPQMHRREADVYANVELLLRYAGRPVPPLANVPNRYLRT